MSQTLWMRSRMLILALMATLVLALGLTSIAVSSAYAADQADGGTGKADGGTGGECSICDFTDEEAGTVN